MASNEEILIGYQVIQKINIGNIVTDNSSWYMRLKQPYSDDPLIIPATAEGEPEKPATVEYVK